jgi:hypothetical protein
MGLAISAWGTDTSFRFSIGYGTYNWWRAQLAQMAYGKPIELVWHENTDAYPEERLVRADNPADEFFHPVATKIGRGPFIELICFSDSHGVIKAPVTTKLARDFAEYADKAAAFAKTIDGTKDPVTGWWVTPPGDDWLYWYGESRKAFEAAADDDGWVLFH